MNSEELEKKKAYSIFLLEDVLGVDSEIIDALHSGLICISESPDKEGNFSYTLASESMQDAHKAITDVEIGLTEKGSLMLICEDRERKAET